METIYALADPRSKRIHWVGRTRSLAARVNCHRNSLRSGHNPRKTRWLRELKRLGMKPEVITLATVPSEQADAEERRFTEQFRTSGQPLFNLATGRRHGLASRRKMSRPGSMHPRWRHDIDDTKLIKLHAQGLSCAEIAQRLGTGATTVHRRLRAAGINDQAFHRLA